MRKVHYQVVLDVFTSEDDNVSSGTEILGEADFWPNIWNSDDVDILDVMTKSVRITDSR
jgi:hypothetical protein